MNGGPSHVDTFDPKPMLADPESARQPPESVRKGRNGGRQADAVQLQVRQIWAGGDRHQRAVPEDRRAGGRPLRHPIDVHRRAQPRARPADDELGRDPADPAQPRVRGSPTASARRTRTCPASSSSARASRSSARSSGATRSCRGSSRGRTSTTGRSTPSRSSPTSPTSSLGKDAQRGQLDLLQRMNEQHLESRPGDPQLEGPDPVA